jgi:hypothetical protein
VVAIPNEAFVSRHVRYQDAPDLCFKVLAKALASSSDAPAYVLLTTAQLDEYKQAHAPKAPRRRPRPVMPAEATATAPPSDDAKPRARNPFGLWRW